MNKKAVVKVNLVSNENSTYNLAFIRALFIKKTIENLEISHQEKEELKEEIIEYLKKN